jgi:hypothetical protein
MAEKPCLQRVLEAVAAAMDLDQGRARLELVFVDGELHRFWTHDENRPAAALEQFEARAGWVAEVLAAQLLRRAKEAGEPTSP